MTPSVIKADLLETFDKFVEFAEDNPHIKRYEWNWEAPWRFSKNPKGVKVAPEVVKTIKSLKENYLVPNGLKVINTVPSKSQSLNTACFIHSTNTILFPSMSFYKNCWDHQRVMFHEFAHSTGKLNGRLGSTTGKLTYHQEECLAECVAGLLMKYLYNKKPTLNSLEYFARYYNSRYCNTPARRLKTNKRVEVELSKDRKDLILKESLKSAIILLNSIYSYKNKNE